LLALTILSLFQSKWLQMTLQVVSVLVRRVIQPLDVCVSPLFAVEPVTIDYYLEKKDTQ
jgi:hypothetical protein